MEYKKPLFRRLGLCFAALFCVLMAPRFVIAGEGEWNDLMRGSDFVVDHQPHNTGGLAADSLFRESEFLPPIWQLVADDFTLPDSATIGHINFWGFYHNNSFPVGDENIRIRFYEPRQSDALPGSVLYEASFLNVSRSFTGRSIITAGAPAELFFSVNLDVPFYINANTLYWLEIVQDGSLDSRFRWEYSRSGELDGHAFNNPFVSEWTRTTNDSNTAFQFVPIPEPSSAGLFVMILLLQLIYRKKRQ